MKYETLFMFLFIIILLGALILCKSRRYEIVKPSQYIKSSTEDIDQESNKIAKSTSEVVDQSTPEVVDQSTPKEVIQSMPEVVDQPNFRLIVVNGPTLLQSLPAVLVEQLPVEPEKIQQISHFENINTNQKITDSIVSTDKPIQINRLVSKNGKYMLDAIGGFKIVRLSDNKILWNADFSKVQHLIEGPVIGKFYPNGTIVLNDNKNYIWNSEKDVTSKLCLLKKRYPYYLLTINDDGSVAVLDSNNNYAWWHKYDREYYKDAFPGTDPTFNFWKKGFYN